VWPIGPVPEVGYSVPKSLYVEEITGYTGIDMRPTVVEVEQRQRFVRALFDELAKKYSVRIIWPEAALCDRIACRVDANGRPLYSDDHHMTIFGAKYISPISDPIFR
jgi:SGNH domain (fused to AT3 domains)